MPSDPAGVDRAVPYHASTSEPAAPPWAQSNSFVTDGETLTRTGSDHVLP